MNGPVMLSWRGPDPQRFDSACVTLGATSLGGHGSSLTSDYALDYRLETGPDWVTRTLDVRARGDGWWRALALRRTTSGEWSADWSGEGLGTLPSELPDLESALDCDLALCPLTNTMPVLRHDLVGASHRGDGGAHDLVMAWISVPDLSVKRSEQRYAVSDPIDEGGALVGYSSSGFRTTIEVDADGLIVNYPGLGRRIERAG
jgi:uncharacterized protein